MKLYRIYRLFDPEMTVKVIDTGKVLPSLSVGSKDPSNSVDDCFYDNHICQVKNIPISLSNRDIMGISPSKDNEYLLIIKLYPERKSKEEGEDKE